MTENYELGPVLEPLRDEWEKAANEANQLFDQVKDFADENFGLTPEFAEQYRLAREKEQKAWKKFWEGYIEASK